jgi:hypothetical protein
MWLLFGEEPDNRPWWVAGTVSAIGIAYAVVRFYFFMRNKSRTFNLQQDKDLQEKQTTARREAAQEAWEVVDRLSAQVEAHDEKIASLEKKHDEAVAKVEERERQAMERAARCEAEHAHLTGRMAVIEAWAKTKGVKIPDTGTGMYPRTPPANPGNPPTPLPPAHQPE